TYGGIMTGGGNLTKDGAGSLVLNGANTNSGTLTMNAGTLALNAAQSFSGNLLLNAGTVVVGDDDAFGSGNIRLYNATIQADGAARTLDNTLRIFDSGGTIAGSEDLSFTGNTIVHGDHTLSVTNSGTTTFANVNLSNNSTDRTLTLNNTGDVVISGTVSDGSSTASSLT